MTSPASPKPQSRRGPKVSVSIVTYQQANYIRQAVESVLAQDTDFQVEIIIGDDSSTDGTREILRELALEEPRIRLLLAEKNDGDGGLSNVMATLDASTGDYIAFLDGDDYWINPLKLRKQIDFLESHPECALCTHRTEHLLDNGDILLSPRPCRGNRVLPSEKLIINNFSEKPATMVRRSAMETLPDWYRTTKVISADWLFNVLVSRHAKIGYLDEIMAVHRLHSDSQSTRHGVRRLLSDKLEALSNLREVLDCSAVTILKGQLLIRAKLAMLDHWPRGYMTLKRVVSQTGR